jgi:hypothetical protein
VHHDRLHSAILRLAASMALPGYGVHCPCIIDLDLALDDE